MAEATLIVSGGFKTRSAGGPQFDAQALESNHVVDALAEEEGARSLVGCGGTLLDQEILIVNPDTMTRCAADEVGEIWVAGPSVAQGYWKRPDETEHTFRAHLADGSGPYLRTGDLGFMQDGELFVTGRLKDLIIIRGLNHYPQDIELTVERSHPFLRAGAGAVLTVEVDGRERLVIVYEVERGRQRDVGEFRRGVRRRSAAQSPRARIGRRRDRAAQGRQHSQDLQRQDPAACLPRGLSATGRWKSSTNGEPGMPPPARPKRAKQCPRRSTRRSGHVGDRERQRPSRDLPTSPDRGGGAGDGAAAEQRADFRSDGQIVLDQVRQIAKERAGDLTLDTNILELGLDSLERMEIVAALEETFGGRFPEEVLAADGNLPRSGRSGRSLSGQDAARTTAALGRRRDSAGALSLRSVSRISWRSSRTCGRCRTPGW